jgi:hypothetical protein
MTVIAALSAPEKVSNSNTVIQAALPTGPMAPGQGFARRKSLRLAREICGVSVTGETCPTAPC